MTERPQAKISLLYLPDGENVELYFWYQGNPFELDKQGYITAQGDNFRHRYVRRPRALEAARRIKALEHEVGSLVIRRNFMVVGVPRQNWSRATHEILGFFNTTNSAMKDIMKPIEYTQADRHGERTEVRTKLVAARKDNEREAIVAASPRELRYKRMRRAMRGFSDKNLPTLRLRRLK